MNSLAGQRVLFLAPRFFGYEQDIIRELTQRGAAVDMLPDRPFETPLMKAVTRFRPELIIGAANRLYRKMLHSFGRTTYDLIFVVNGQTLSPTMLGELRAAFPRAKYVLYLWDSFHNRGSALRNLKFFDDCLSFDRECARAYGLRFRPLFFSDDFASPPGDTFDYHLSFVGTTHTDRYAIVSQLAASLSPSLQFYRHLYLQAPWVFYAFKLTNSSFRRAKITDFRFQPLAREAVRKVFLGSRAILDIEHPRQTGLTIRTLETLGASRKLITTNGSVVEYDFYLPENVCVINRTSPRIPEGFLEAPYRSVAPTIYRKYSLPGWLDDVLCDSVSPIAS